MAELSSMEVHALPAPALRPYVSGYVGFRLSGFPAGVHLGTPSRALTAVISLADDLDVEGTAGTTGAATSRGGYASVGAGLQTRSVGIHHTGRLHGVQLSLTPLGARAVYGVPAAELVETLVPLQELLGPLGPELLDRLRAATGWNERFGILDALLTRAVERRAGAAPRGREIRPEVAETWHRLVAAHGQVRVGAVAAAVGWSRRHLAERFRAEVGLAPKMVARILRFEHAHRLATADDPRSWADVSTQAGYADQAHLVRDWREFTGRTPTAWRGGEVLLGGAGH
jgi:AraC-like DNA-binding protein